MSLRYRLFLWVSGLFVFVALCSFFLENYVSRRELAKAQQVVRQKILDMSEKRRLDMQKFLAESIAENAVRIDAVLNNISSFSPMALRFAPSLANEKRGSWGDASDLLVEHKWIDFLQNTSEDKVISAIVPQADAMSTVFRLVIDEDLSWVYDSSLNPNLTPFLGVRVPYSLAADISSTVTDEILQQVQGIVPEVFLLFDPQDMGRANLKIPLFQDKQLPPVRIKWTGGYELDVAEFVASFQKAKEQILSHNLRPPSYSKEQIQEQIQNAEKTQDGLLFSLPNNTLFSSIASEGVIKQKLENAALRYTQINVIWLLVAMLESGVFGDDFFSYPVPLSTTVFSSNNTLGFAVETQKVLFKNTIFDDRAYYMHNAPAESHANLATSLAIIPSPDSSHLFLGNTAELLIHSINGNKTGFLTLGVDSETLLQRLTLAIHQAAFLVHDEKALSAYDEDGQKMDSATLQPFLPKILQQKMGIIEWNGQKYFYMHVQPFAQLDLHFFLLNPEAKQFALLRDLESGSKRVVDSILLNLHLAGLIALLVVIILVNNISRRITKPIIELAQATKDVAAGRLDQIQLSLPKVKHKDEIAILCHSFEDMVSGLQEKEKVKGVLNKVVSPEIASEILKGTVHLGGEEKKVTVLFADIREFTKMTQHMPPKEVIDLLNACMTKISLVIDKNHGVIDKYVGDEAMALFGAPISTPGDALNAIKSAIEMMEVIKIWNQERVQSSLAPVELGIGIHTGQVLVGNMGAENRLNYTVIGSNVNLCARLCSAAKRMEILITKDTLDEPGVKESIVYEQISPLSFKGFDLPVDVFSIKGLVSS